MRPPLGLYISARSGLSMFSLSLSVHSVSSKPLAPTSSPVLLSRPWPRQRCLPCRSRSRSLSRSPSSPLSYCGLRIWSSFWTSTMWPRWSFCPLSLWASSFSMLKESLRMSSSRPLKMFPKLSCCCCCWPRRLWLCRLWPWLRRLWPWPWPSHCRLLPPCRWYCCGFPARKKCLGEKLDDPCKM